MVFSKSLDESLFVWRALTRVTQMGRISRKSKKIRGFRTFRDIRVKNFLTLRKPWFYPRRSFLFMGIYGKFQQYIDQVASRRFTW